MFINKQVGQKIEEVIISFIVLLFFVAIFFLFIPDDSFFPFSLLFKLGNNLKKFNLCFSFKSAFLGKKTRE